MCKISVIIPVYNVEPYLARCLNSLINQTLKDIEIICINDCSTDNSLGVIRGYEKKDERIKVVDFKENQGAAAARNEGLKLANGEYLGFVDPDDYVDLNFYEELYNKAKQDNSDIVKAERKTTELDGRITATDLNKNIIKSGNKFAFSYEWTTAIYKNDLIKRNNILFPIECRKAQDIVFLFRCILKSNKLSVIHNVFYNYIRRETSLNSDRLSLDKVKSALKAIELILEDLNNSDLCKQSLDLYITVYKQYLGAIFYPLYKSSSYEGKFECAKALIELYNKCKKIKELDEEYDYLLLKDYIKTNDCESLTKLFLKYDSSTKLREVNILYKLRNNIKKDIANV